MTRMTFGGNICLVILILLLARFTKDLLFVIATLFVILTPQKKPA